MSTLHLISHTHWDREWYLTFQQFRLKLVHLIDGLLEILENDPDYKYFLLDGQTILLEDYLQLRPEREPELTRMIANGRILIGPWYISPDEFLLSPESHVRNLLEGKRLCQKFGGQLRVGYLPDTFGHIGQMPQILLGFGIDAACVWRGLDDQPLELNWRSPDGSEILLSYLRESYSNAANVTPDQPDKFIAQVSELSRTLTPFSATGQLLLMHGTDHMEPSKSLTAALQAYQRKSPPDELRHSNFSLYFEAVRSYIASYEITHPVVAGELRSSKHSPLLSNVLSTRMWIKQRNHQCENELIKWVEPLNAWSQLIQPSTKEQMPASSNHPYLANQKNLIQSAWKMLMQCHPHDSICGTSIDQVHREMEARFDQVDQVSQALVDQNLHRICEQIDTQFITVSGDLIQAVDILAGIVVLNPNDQPQSGMIETNLKLDEHYSSVVLLDDQNARIPFHQIGTGLSELISMTMDKKGLKQGLGMVHDGVFAGVAIREFDIEPQGSQAFIRATISSQGLVDHGRWKIGMEKLERVLADEKVTEFVIHAYSDPEVGLSFIARDIPAHGFRTYWVSGDVESRPAAGLPRKLPSFVNVLLPALKITTQRPILRSLMSRRNHPADHRPARIENEFLAVDIARPDGSLSITDKRTQRKYIELNRFVDGGDCGDLYNYCPPEHDQLIRARLTSIQHVETETSRSLIIHSDMALPKSIAEDRKSRSRERKRHELISTVTLLPGVPRVDVHVDVDNQASDHRLRVHFPAPFSCSSAYHDGHYEVVERMIGLPAHDAWWVEPPRPEVPQRAFTFVTDGQASLTIANRGLPEVEVLKATGGDVEIALTFLRCVGWLSRDDLATRKGHAGPMGIATPEAQMAGRYSFDYSIIPGDSQVLDSIHLAYAFETPLRAMVTSAHPGALPSTISFIQNSNPHFLITAIKSSEGAAGLVVRGFNLQSTPIEVALTPFRPFKQACLVSLAEEPSEPVPIGHDGQVRLHVAGKKILTIRFSD